MRYELKFEICKSGSDVSIYVIIHNISMHVYSVVAREFVYADDIKIRIAEIWRNNHTLAIEHIIDDGLDWHETVEEAVQSFLRDFD